MSGLTTLLEAAEYIEQQEKLKLSPQAATPTILTDTRYLLHRADVLYDNNVSNGNRNGIRNSISNRQQQQQHVSSSAPAAGATFHHHAAAAAVAAATTNGLTITGVTLNGSNNNNHSQLSKQQHRNNDLEFSNGNSSSSSSNIQFMSTAATQNQSVRSGQDARMSVSANNLLLQQHNNGNQQQQPQNMLLDDAHSSNQSPPRQHSSGSHYMQMLSAQQGSQVAHATQPISSSGRRRTISSNSNGAGTREVHNKLEKNRRAHLKECYEALKNELPLKEEDRRKTSNLAILEKAFNHVKSLQKQDKDLEATIEQSAKEKINLQKRIVSLKRELGPRYDQIFSGIFPDPELGSIPSEKDTLNDAVSLSTRRGSMLYSSSSSLSSGGSNTMSSPVGAGLQTAMPTAISPVISKMNMNGSNNAATITIAAAGNTSPISPNSSNSSNSSTVSNNMLLHLKATAISANNNSSNNSSTLNVGIVNAINNSSMPLSLTAKNISATSLTRGSPTPSTPSLSPSSSSGVSSSSSLISSSPPMNGVINGAGVAVARNVAAVVNNIPNGLKFQTSGGATIGTLGNATAATIIAAAAAAANAGTTSNNNNNAKMLQALRGCHLV